MRNKKKLSLYTIKTITYQRKIEKNEIVFCNVTTADEVNEL